MDGGGLGQIVMSEGMLPELGNQVVRTFQEGERGCYGEKRNSHREIWDASTTQRREAWWKGRGEAVEAVLSL